MKRFVAFLKSTLLGGLIVMLPAVAVMQCISKWGGGSDKLVAAYDAASSRAISLMKPTKQQQIAKG